MSRGVYFGWIACMLLANMLAIPHQALGQGTPRPTVEPRSEAERLLWSLDSQRQQIDANRVSIERYLDWFKREGQTIDGMRQSLRSAQAISQTASASWNNRVNPTCDSGQTFANCSCADGRANRARMQAVIQAARANEDSQRSKLNRTVDNYNANLDRYRRLRDTANAAVAAYNDGVATYNRMTRPGAQGSPDSMGEIERRAREQNR